MIKLGHILACLSWPDHPSGEILIWGVGKRAIAFLKIEQLFYNMVMILSSKQWNLWKSQNYLVRV
ncbi:hypothetical protein PL11201_510066 [Planktothrix sp. PCC 11201]|nr:hypothetical protein PL11201_510066 [Planktothrix sp. PCC 11201]